MTAPRLLTALLVLTIGLSGCGFTVAPADLFQLHRTGGARPLTMIVSDGGTVRCDGRGPRPVSDALLIAARDLAADLDKDAKGHLRLAARPGSVYWFSVTTQDGTVTFADNSGGAHPELGRAELLAAQIASGPCAGR